MQEGQKGLIDCEFCSMSCVKNFVSHLLRSANELSRDSTLTWDLMFLMKPELSSASVGVEARESGSVASPDSAVTIDLRLVNSQALIDATTMGQMGRISTLVDVLS